MIDLEQARDLLKRAVETQGREFVYNPGGQYDCLYTPLVGDASTSVNPDDPRTKTGCLVGVALDLAGETFHHETTMSIGALAEGRPEVLTAEAAEYFSVAQVNQDNGESWGTAFDRAEAIIGVLHKIAI